MTPCSKPAIAQRIFDSIGQDLKLPGETEVPFKQLGIVDEINGINVHQTKRCMRMLLLHQRGVLKYACPHIRRTDLFDLVQSHVRTNE